jgi:hypothetical protein
MLPSQQASGNIPAVIGQEIQCDRLQAICNSPHCEENGRHGQDDTILWIPLTWLASSDDHHAVQTDDRDQGA